MTEVLRTSTDLRRRRLALGISVLDLARAVAVDPHRLMDLEERTELLDEPEVYERAFAGIRRRANLAQQRR